jgi:diguanylate cyclase (GGDEF)-like protein
VDQDDFQQSLSEGPALPARLVEALLLLCQGNFTYRLRRTLSRDYDDTVAFFFNAIAEELERLITTARENEARMSTLIQELSEALVGVASGDFSIQVERDYRGDPADVLSFLVNNTIKELAELVAISDRRAADDRQRLELLVEARTIELRMLASTDELTAILNRRRILEVAAEECQRTARYRDPLCIAMFDIDHFKSINDQFGHSVGDHALRLVAAAARSQLRLQDQIGRYGGEEFLIVFPETPLEGATRVTERVRAAIESMATHEGGHRVPLTVSAGVAEVTRGEALDFVLQRVDAAMYRAKAAGRNRVVV